MKKSIFEKIADLINGTTKTSSSETEEAVTHDNVSGQNVIEKKDKLIKAVIAKLQENYRGENYSMEDKKLCISIMDNMFYDSVCSSVFKDELETSVSDELGMFFNSIEIKDSLLPENVKMSELLPDVYIAVQTISRAKAIRRAIIRSVENNGSTLSPEYYLDSEDIANQPNCRYNIGAGKNPVMSNNLLRENYIAIDDDPNSSEYDKNKYVSRSHAYITYSEDAGFLLYVEHGGSHVAKKRTHVHRGNEKIELTSTVVPVQLRNGDYIVLSKHVYLLFKEA